ncbi:MAG: twin-arginine translocase subunit TatC [Thermoguttaceae bacterium]|nr:twin-arginine translocase subunit TatC [Thermoguttaceae bacterium]
MSKINEDDYFQDSTMSFGEHLEELRRCLIRAIAGLVVGFIIGLFIGGHVVEMVQSPLKRALTSYYQGRTEKVISTSQDEFIKRGYGEDILALPTQYGLVGEKYLVNPDELGKALGVEVKDISADPENPCNQIGEGIQISSEDVEERNRKWKFADYFNVEKWAQWVSESWTSKGIDLNEDVSKTVREESVRSEETQEPVAENPETSPETPAEAPEAAQAPVAENSPEPVVAERKKTRLVSIYLWKPTVNDERTQVKNFAVQETFMIYLKAALVAGLIISSPWIFWQIWSFIAAGLYPNEKRYVHIFLPFSLGLFLGGNLLAFFFVFEPVLQYLFSFNEWMGIAPDPRISEWLGFFLFLPIGFGISFQLPLVMLFLNRIGVCEVSVYSKYWRVALLIIFFLSMILTPADPTSMVLMAIPLSALYLGGIALCRVFPRRLNPLAEMK